MASSSSAAILAGMHAPAALSEDEAKELLYKVAERFNFQPEIADYLLSLGVRSLSDFQNCVTSKEAIDKELTAKMPETTSWTGSRMVQTARVRMAWESTFQATQAETKKAAAYEDASQDLLPEEELSTLEQKWWRRYKFNPDPERCPSDYVVTTAARQLKSRRIVAPNFLTVKTLHQQKARTKQRLQIGSAGGKSLEIVEEGAADARARDLTLDNYFLGVELWAMAWAKKLALTLPQAHRRT